MITTPFTPANPEAVSLGAGEVHLWRVQLPEQAPAETALEAAELERFRRLVDPLTQARRLNCRNMLRRILGAYLRRPAADIRFRSGPHGRPHLDESVHPTDLNFNLSHAGSLAVIALARVRRLGVDIEAERALPRLDSLLARCFSSAEARFLRSRPAGERGRFFLRSWTAKEALLKAEGSGVFHQPAALEVAWEPLTRLLRTGADRVKAAEWKLWEFVPTAGMVGMLALPAGAWEVRCLAYPGERAQMEHR